MSADPSPRPQDIVSEALARAVIGDAIEGGMLLVPLISESRRSCYALAGMLAETASHIARRERRPGTGFVITVENVVTGAAGSVDVMPPAVAFAAQFITAWANRDQDTAQALFDALADQAVKTDGPELVDGVLELFAMAVTTAKAVRAEERAKRRTQPTEGDTP